MTQTLYIYFTFMSRRDEYYLFYKNYTTSHDKKDCDGKTNDQYPEKMLHSECGGGHYGLF